MTEQLHTAEHYCNDRKTMILITIRKCFKTLYQTHTANNPHSRLETTINTLLRDKISLEITVG